ncbi:MAG: hypothetical protein ACI9S8_002600 [Chlamydiales bacterium]|jgi:hypothetical protein
MDLTGRRLFPPQIFLWGRQSKSNAPLASLVYNLRDLRIGNGIQKTLDPK